MLRSLLVFIASLQSISGLLVGTGRAVGIRNGCHVKTDALCMMAAPEPQDSTRIDRRSLLSVPAKILPAAVVLSTLSQPVHAADDKGKIVVFGGSGYVGAHVDKLLAEQGYKVVAVSRSSPQDQAAKVSKILGVSPTVEYVSLDAGTDDLSGVLSGADAVVSCVGVAPGGSNQREGNGAVNARIANAAKTAGIKRFVYISVASSLANGPAKFLLGDYFKGKAEGEAAVVKAYPSEARLVIKPAFIAGGPPGEIRPPGPPGVKPATVESVAKIVVAGATGQQSGSIDGNDAIAAF